MIPKELLREIRRIHIRTLHMANDLFAGQYHAAFKGRGMEFEEVREYQPGDDVRSIDWNVTARAGRPFVKRFREERELTVLLLVDLSRSQDFGTAGELKRGLVAKVCATLAFSAIQNNDKVGLIAFSDAVERYVPPKKGATHVLRVVRELLTLQPRGRGTNVSAALEYLNRVTTRRAVVFVVSDFQAAGYESALRIARRRHDVIPITVTDRREVELPAVRFIELVDAESGEVVTVDTASPAFREEYSRRAQQMADGRKREFRRMRIEPIDLFTGQSFVEPLQRFFHARETRL